jgi:hypothetical protein
MKKLLIAAAAIVTAGAPMAASAAPFGGPHLQPVAVQNHWNGGHWNSGWGHGWGGGYRYGGYGRDGYGYGPGYYRAIVPGVFGLAIGAALARPYYAPCHYVTRTVVGPWGGVHYQNVEVCARDARRGRRAVSDGRLQPSRRGGPRAARSRRRPSSRPRW